MVSRLAGTSTVHTSRVSSRTPITMAVTSGYRISLTYNLLVHGDTSALSAAAALAPARPAQ